MRMTTLLLLLLIHISPGQAQTAVVLPVDGWQSATTGQFEAWVDRRELMVLYHPWEPSGTGFSATVAQTVTVPTTWINGARLHFYMSDDYDASRAAMAEGWLGQINLVGHRFKQVLLNDKVIWEQDVADAVVTDAGLRFDIPLPASVQGGDTVRLGFRLFDRVGSGERLARDHRHIGSTDNITAEDPWRFWTHLYIGDVTLTPAEVEAIEYGAMPALAVVKKRHEAQSTRAPQSERPLLPVKLQVRHPPSGNIPFPMVCGIPFPVGKVRQPQQIWLRTTAGAAVACAANTMNTWPDGSIRWARLIAILPAKTTEVELGVGTVAAPTPDSGHGHAASIEKEGSGLVLAPFGSEGNLRLKLQWPLRINGTDAALQLDTAATISSSMLHAEVEARGRIKAEEADYGHYVLRLLTFAKHRSIRIDYRLFNDRPETLAISRQSLLVEWHANARSIADAATPGWLAAVGEGGSLLGVIRHFREQPPKSISYQGHHLDLRLVDSAEETPAYQPHEGEAKRHELWLGAWEQTLSQTELAAQAEWMANPPGLFQADYFCASGAMGQACPHDAKRFPELTTFMETTYGPMAAEVFSSNGIRHWGDTQYNPAENSWRNGYYDSQQGFASEYLMTGRAEWFQRLEANVRHIIDVDICHACVEHPDWIGSIHGYYGKDHSTGGPWNPTQRTMGTLAYWRFTADRDARDAALGVADSALAAGRGLGAQSVRDHAGILCCLTAAYDETGAAKYLEAAGLVAHDALKRIDARRGAYVEIHGNTSYRGNVPWMVAQLMEPMWHYYRQSGDLAAAEAVVAMAESILAENRTRQVPGDVHGYSHNPHFNKSSNYHILIAPAILYAYDLTGDAEFLRQARAMYQQTIEEKSVNSIINCYWNTPTLLHYLDKHQDEVTE